MTDKQQQEPNKQKMFRQNRIVEEEHPLMPGMILFPPLLVLQFCRI